MCVNTEPGTHSVYVNTEPGPWDSQCMCVNTEPGTHSVCV